MRDDLRPVLIRFTVKEYDHYLKCALRAGYRYFTRYVKEAVEEKAKKGERI